MLFHEIYGKYYAAAAKVLRLAVEKGRVTGEEVRRTVSENGFSESALYIPQALEDRWFLLRPDGSTVLKHPPSRPLTVTEKRWLKALLADPRIRLFDPPDRGLEAVEPLFTGDMFCHYDRYSDGDPWEDPGYIGNFRQLTLAITRGKQVRLTYRGNKGEQVHVCTPQRLEYSEKDDKFRLMAAEGGKPLVLNLSKVVTCQVLDLPGAPPVREPETARAVLILKDRRNTLERAMLHFSHLEKETEQLEDHTYRLTLYYDPRDQQELLIRILSFGPTVKVTEPASLVSQVRHRIGRQLEKAL